MIDFFLRCWLGSLRYRWSRLYRRLFENRCRNSALPPVQSLEDIRAILDQVRWVPDSLLHLYDSISYPAATWARKQDDCDGFASLAAALLLSWRPESSPVLLTVVMRPVKDSHTVCVFRGDQGWLRVFDNNALRGEVFRSYSEVAGTVLRENHRLVCWDVADPLTLKTLEFHDDLPEKPDETPDSLNDSARQPEKVRPAVKNPSSKDKTSLATWVVVGILILGAVISGIWGFTTRPVQSGTFRANFNAGTELRMEINPAMEHTVYGVVSGLELRGHDQPVEIDLYLAAEQRTALAKALGVEYRPGDPVKVTAETRFVFSQPVELMVDIVSSREVKISRGTGEGGNARLQISAKSPHTQGTFNEAPQVRVKLVPPHEERTFEIYAGKQPAGKYDLKPGLMDQSLLLTLQVSTNPVSKDTGEVLTLDFSGKEPDFQAWFGLNAGELAGPAGLNEEIIEVKDAPGGILTTGAATQSFQAGERLRINLSSPEDLKIIGNRISLDALESSVITRAVRNEALDLLPLRYNLWPDWGQQLWRWGAITMGAGAVAAILRKLKLWPS